MRATEYVATTPTVVSAFEGREGEGAAREITAERGSIGLDRNQWGSMLFNVQ